MFIKWLQERTTIEKAEQEHLTQDTELGPDPIPFGFINEKWLYFKAQMRSGDELWKFSSPPRTWQHLCGREGFCIVRNGKIVDYIITVMN